MCSDVAVFIQFSHNENGELSLFYIIWNIVVDLTRSTVIPCLLSFDLIEPHRTPAKDLLKSCWVMWNWRWWKCWGIRLLSLLSYSHKTIWNLLFSVISPPQIFAYGKNDEWNLDFTSTCSVLPIVHWLFGYLPFSVLCSASVYACLDGK